MKYIFSVLLLTSACLFSTELSIIEKSIDVNGKQAVVLGLAQPDGTLGIRAEKGEKFNVLLRNTMDVPTSIHWHGLILPNSQDGVAFVTQFPLYPGLSYRYDFPLVQTGTYWMHSHFSLQEQLQLSAPLIIYDPEEANLSDKEAILFLSDFSFKRPLEIFRNLRCNKQMSMHDMNNIKDVIDVNYDALIANYRTLDNAEIIAVEPGQKVRLRIINGSSATNFFIKLGRLEGEAIAVDGNRIEPLKGNHFELAVAQRMDIIVQIPQEGGAFPIIGQGEATDMVAGFVLATKNVELPKLSSKAPEKASAFTNAQETKLKALVPLKKRPVQRSLVVELGGNMADYTWTLNGQAWPEVTPLVVESGERVEIVFKNKTAMSHPMHLHGHVFQVTAIDGQHIEGALRDTVLVKPNSTLAIQFDADNPGVWPLHCHILYHLEAGMFTVLRYNDFIQPL